MKKYFRIMFFLWLAIFCLGGCMTPEGTPVSGSGTKSELEVHFLDVGQGDCTLIICEGHSMLIDAGDNSKGTAVQNYLKKQGITSLDYVIGTHPDADHIGGLDVIIYKFECSAIIMPAYSKDTKTYNEVVDTVRAKNYRITDPAVGTEYQLGAASFTIVAPGNGPYSNANDYSVGILLQHGDNRFLLVGDAEEVSEAEMEALRINISADVLKVPHHGSKTSTTDSFLTTVNPGFAVISCGQDNSYGHPHSEVLNKLRAAGVEIFRTDEQGTVIAVSNGKEITWNCAPTESWQAGEPGAAWPAEESVINHEQPSQTEPEDNAVDAAYILNTNTKKFHLSGCASVKTIADTNKAETDLSKEELRVQGYSPCKRCIGEE